MRTFMVLVALLAGCGDGDHARGEQAQPYVTIVLRPDTAELTPGATVQLKILLLRDNSSEQVNGTFASNDETIAKVDENTGVVTALARGTTTITGRYGPGLATATITVK